MITRRLLLTSTLAACATEPPMPSQAVYDFRNYTMQPGQRDVLIDLFEREFIESQEALGTRVVATFRNLDDPDRFVWIRGFDTLATRAAALNGFYSGPIWQANRTAANATIIDSDDVLQLRPIAGDVTRGAQNRPPIGAAAIPETLIVATTYFLADHQDHAFAGRYGREVLPILREIGAEPFASFATEHAPNRYPRLPVRETETVFVTLSYFASAEAHREHMSASSAAWRDVAGVVQPSIIAPTQTLRLQPTARSLLR
jgi:heme-degrading monooxygenase HmoA